MHEAVAVAFINPPVDARFRDVDAEKDRAVQSRGERLRAAHPAHPARDEELSREAAAKMTVRHRRKRLERALDDALRADVNPTARGHLPVHHQAFALKLMKIFPGGPGADQI